MPEPLPRIIAVTEQFRAELLAGERAAATRMVRAYGGAWARLVPRIDAITADIEARQAKGEEVSPDWLRRQARYLELERQMLEELRRFSTFADMTTLDGQQQAVEAALAHSRELVAQALPPGLGLPQLAELGIGWNQLPREAMLDLVGRLGDGSPLRTLFDAIPGQVTAAAGDALLNGVAQGWGPRKTAAVMRRETGMGLSRALRISRTETLRSYRTAARRQYEQNPGLVKGWRRTAAKNGRTCLACLMLDGTEYPTAEDMDDHVQGRCSMVPICISWADLGLPIRTPPTKWTTGKDWFEGQPEAVQREMMGPAMHEAWKAGKLRLEQLPKRHTDPDWGPSWTVASLKDLGIDWRKAEGGPPVAMPKAPKPILPMPTRQEMVTEIGNRLTQEEAVGAERRVELEKARDTISAKIDALFGQRRSEQMLRRPDQARIADLDRQLAEQTPQARAIEEQLQQFDLSRLGRYRKTLEASDPMRVTIQAASDLPENTRAMAEGAIDKAALLVSGKVLGQATVKLAWGQAGGRSYYDDGTIHVAVTGVRGEKTVAHELGHLLEERGQGIQAKATDFYNRRTAGEKEEWLGDAYDKAERTRRDKFLDPYMGVKYADGTELISMGMELLYSNPLKLLRQDPEYFEFIIGVLRGI